MNMKPLLASQAGLMGPTFEEDHTMDLLVNSLRSRRDPSTHPVPGYVIES
jgi:hypothetical protein